MKVELRQSGVFEAAHRLANVPASHKCHRMHGHRYKVIVAVAGEVGPSGFLVDYLDLEQRLNDVLSLLDHRCLNDISEPESQPTVEWLSQWIYCRMLPGLPLASVEVQETETASCIYRGE